MTSPRTSLTLAGGLVLAALATAGPASAAELPGGRVSATESRAQSCTTKQPAGPAVRHLRTSADRTGLLRLTLAGGTGDWDVAAFDAESGRFVAGSAQPGTQDLAQGFVAAGQRLDVQLCRFAGPPGEVEVRAEAFTLKQREGAIKPQVVAVRTPTRAHKDRLGLLGLDPAEGATKRSVDVVLHDAEDVRSLQRAGLRWDVKIPDLLAADRSRAERDAEYASRVATSNLPSGRDEYRHLADFEAEMKQLALSNPGQVRLVEMPHKSLEGRTILGIEVGKDVNVDDGRPVFLQLGVHHAREWPSAEHVMEWGLELVNGFGKDPRLTKVMETSKTILVPVVNPDGFNLSREAPVDAGNALAAIDLPAEIDNEETLPITDPTYTAAILADQLAGTFAYKRRNCRVVDGQVPGEGECGDSANRTTGVDPNRNYGGLWGGPGASLDPGNDTYRGAAPFSEPETQGVRELVLSRQVTALITNHTFTGLILRPPGVRSQGPPVDEPAYKALGDAMAAQNGYKSQLSYQLYDTTGTTEDWSYGATGGFGFTFEIGKDEFHPPFEEMVREYTGPTELGGPGGNRGAYLLAAEWAADPANHSVIKGRAPAGTTLRVRKEFLTETSPVIVDETGKTEDPRTFKDVLDTTTTVGPSGRFEWHVNPSTRPHLQKQRVVSGVAEKAAEVQEFSSPRPPVPGVPDFYEIKVTDAAHRQIRASTVGTVPVDDIDIYLYEGSKAPENQVASSAGGTADEALVYDNPTPGKTYVLEVRNFAAAGPYDGRFELYAEREGSRRVLEPTTEAYTFTCERGGKVLREQKVELARGAQVDVGNACATGAARGTSPLKLSAAFDRRSLGRALRSGLRVRVACRGAACRTLTTRLVVSARDAKRYGLSKRARQVVVGRGTTARDVSGRRTFTVRFTKAARSKLARARSLKLTLLAQATDRQGRKVARATTVRLRR